MILRTSVAFLCGSLCVCVSAQSTLCSEGMTAINAELRYQSLRHYQSIGDNSAPRETNRILRDLRADAFVARVLGQMRDAGCAKPKMLISTAPYDAIVSTCIAEKRKTGVVTDSTLIAQCLNPLEESKDLVQ